MRERSAKWNEKKGNGTARSFGDRTSGGRKRPILESSVLAAIECSLSTVVHDFQEFDVILLTDDKRVRLSRLSISNYS